MSMSDLQDYIRKEGFASLSKEFGVEIREYPNYGLYVLNYSQINSPRFHPIVDQCRGLTLDSNANVVARSFSRFYNFGEGNTKNFDFTNITVWEKADGSLTRIAYCPQTNRWEISTRGTAFAEANHVFSLANGGSFRKWILRAMRFESEGEFQNAMERSGLPKDRTYVAEYIGPENRIVTRYEESQLVMLAVFDNVTEEEYPIAETCEILQSVRMNIRLPELYNISSEEELLNLCNDLPDLKEGVVVRHNITGERLKVKSRQYCVAHQIKGEASPTLNSLMELVLTNEHHEFLSYFEEFKPLVDPISNALEDLLNVMEAEFEKYKDISDQKEFALAIKHLPYTGVLFFARKNKTTPRHSFHNMLLTQRMNLLEMKLKENDISIVKKL